MEVGSLQFEFSPNTVKGLLSWELSPINPKRQFYSSGPIRQDHTTQKLLMTSVDLNARDIVRNGLLASQAPQCRVPVAGATPVPSNDGMKTSRLSPKAGSCAARLSTKASCENQCTHITESDVVEENEDYELMFAFEM